MFPLFRRCPRRLVVLGLGCAAIFSSPSLASAQVKPAHIAAAQAAQAPYRNSGRIFVQQGPYAYTGTATTVRRYTGLTAGHMLYEPVSGFSTQVRYEPALYETPATTLGARYLAVLAGYQDAAGTAVEAKDAFEHDLGFLIFDGPAAGNQWAAWSADPALLGQTSGFLALGYAGETLSPDILSQMGTNVPFTLAQAPGLYENDGYVSEGGTSGGPVYAVDTDGKLRVAAVTVAGSVTRARTFSAVRALTPDEGPWLLDAEYLHGAITGGFIKGPATVTPGQSVKYKTGVTFVDGGREAGGWSSRYDEAVLAATGPNKKRVQVTRLKSGKFAVRAADDAPLGTTVKLVLIRNTAKPKTQTPLQSLTLMVQ